MISPDIIRSISQREDRILGRKAAQGIPKVSGVIRQIMPIRMLQSRSLAWGILAVAMIWTICQSFQARKCRKLSQL
jgi:hypothetical protein